MINYFYLNFETKCLIQLKNRFLVPKSGFEVFVLRVKVLRSRSFDKKTSRPSISETENSPVSSTLARFRPVPNWQLLRLPPQQSWLIFSDESHRQYQNDKSTRLHSGHLINFIYSKYQHNVCCNCEHYLHLSIIRSISWAMRRFLSWSELIAKSASSLASVSNVLRTTWLNTTWIGLEN